MRYQGRITDWNDDRGYGFITPNGGGSRVFLHISAFKTRQRRPDGNELVTYELSQDDRGRPKAEGVAFVGDTQSPAGPRIHGNTPLWLAGACLLFVSGAVVLGRLPLAVLGLYLAASAIAFIAYALDKSAAKNNEWRTQESTLLFVGLIGGWPGAVAAQRVLRHKSSKKSFQLVFWATVVLNCGGLAWLLTPTGANLIRSVVGTS